MKVLHYLFGLPPVRTGGLPQYAIDLMHGEQQLGMDVSMLVPGPIQVNGEKKVRIQKRRKWQKIDCYRIVNPLYIPNAYGMREPKEFMKPVDISIYKSWLKKITVDIVHIHSFMGLHCEFIQAARILNIPIVYTTHDFFGLCPKTDLLVGNNICNGKDWTLCVQCSRNAYSLKRLWMEQTALYKFYLNSKLLTTLFRKINSYKKHSQLPCSESYIQSQTQEDYKLLKKYYIKMFMGISFFHYNSWQTKEIFDSFIGVRNGKVVLITNNSISDQRVKRFYGKVLRIGYLGSTMHLKGYDFLKSVLQELYNKGNSDFILNVYTPFKDTSDEFIHWHKPYNKDQLSMVFDNIDVLAVPSLCNETFGMVVPEALSYGVPVIVSERVGAKALLEAWPETGIICKLSFDDWYKQLHKIYNNREILDKFNENILKYNISFSFSSHIDEIKKIYEFCITKG